MVLYALSIAFIVRNTIRIFDFLQVDNGYISKHEVMLYIFDGTFMLFTVTLLLLVHPGQLLKAVRQAWKNGPGEVIDELALLPVR